MRLVVVSHKECWRDPVSESGFSTVGGFPFQIEAISRLFTSTSVAIPCFGAQVPAGASAISGHNLEVLPLSAPRGSGLVRKVSLVPWLLMNIRPLVTSIREADVVHALVPGDIGTLGLLIAVLMRRRVFVRHCGTWGFRGTLASRFLNWFLIRIAGRSVVVFATGGGEDLPEPRNPSVSWVFSTSLSEEGMRGLPTAAPWIAGTELRLVYVGRLTRSKNIRAILPALKKLRDELGAVSLSVVGDGEDREVLERMTHQLDVEDVVRFHGNVPHGEVLRVLGQSHLFVFPTKTAEGFPKAVLEALATGLPVIASPVSVIPHLLNQGAGLLLSEQSGDLADLVLGLTRQPDLLLEMSVRARQVAEAFTLERWASLIAGRLESEWSCSLGRLK